MKLHADSVRKIFTAGAALALPLLLSGCMSSNILEHRMTLGYECAVSRDGSELTLSGTSSGSALLVKKVKKKREGHDLLVNVHIGLFSRSKTGSFSERIYIVPGLSRVLFGRERVVVWTRALGCAPT